MQAGAGTRVPLGNKVVRNASGSSSVRIFIVASRGLGDSAGNGRGCLGGSELVRIWYFVQPSSELHGRVVNILGQKHPSGRGVSSSSPARPRTVEPQDPVGIT